MNKIIFSLFLLILAFSICLFGISCGTEANDNKDGKLIVNKTSSHNKIRTVHPGEDLTYTFTLKNQSTEEKDFEITDIIPENTSYKSGDATLKGNSLTLKATVPAGEIRTLSYTVTVSSDTEKIGEPIISDSAMFCGEKLSCEDVYIGRTFNEYDMQKLTSALYAMRDSEMRGKDLLNFYFRIAFSLNNPIQEDASDIANALFLDIANVNSKSYSEMVVPTLYGGKAASENESVRFGWESSGSISIENIFPGDILVVLPSASDVMGAKMFVTDGASIFDITKKTTKVSTEVVIENALNADYFALLRPSLKIENEVFYRSKPLYEGKNDIENAIIATADAFLLRGDRMQYADTRLVTGKTIYRWERGKSPEDYTLNEIGYTNCTGFTHDVYYAALGWDYGSFKLSETPKSMIAYQRALNGKETDTEKAQIEMDYRAALQVGDIIYYSYSGNNHAMIYLGNGNLMHATGTVYSDYTETQEAVVRYQNLDCLFTPGNSRYFFQTEKPRTALYIIRPLNNFCGVIPEETVNRISNMQGIVAEKLVSHTLGQTVNPGENITYTFKIFNSNNHTVSINIKDSVPTGTTLLVDEIASAERSLSWDLNLAPKEEVLISYTVTVSENAEYGTAIHCSDNSTVCGVFVKNPVIFVGKTLSQEEQIGVVNTTLALLNSGKSSIALANEIYQTVFGINEILGPTMSDLRSGIFLSSAGFKVIATEGNYAELIAPTLYGGKNVDNSDRFLGERTRMLWERNLIVGDILYYQSEKNGYLYIYIGNGRFIDLQKFTERDAYERLEEAIGWKEFAVLRPSLLIGINSKGTY